MVLIGIDPYPYLWETCSPLWSGLWSTTDQRLINWSTAELQTGPAAGEFKGIRLIQVPLLQWPATGRPRTPLWNGTGHASPRKKSLVLGPEIHVKFMLALVPDIIFQVSTLQQSNHELENCPPKNEIEYRMIHDSIHITMILPSYKCMIIYNNKNNNSCTNGNNNN